VKKLLFLCAALIMTFSTVSAHAATDLTGAWDAVFTSADGSMTFDLTCTMKQDGTKLTGTIVATQGGDPATLDNGKIDGEKVSFDTTYNGMVIHHTGTVNSAGDEIKLVSTSDAEGFSGGGLTLKRSKAPVPTAAPVPAPAPAP
jgi:hypothetical protein